MNSCSGAGFHNSFASGRPGAKIPCRTGAARPAALRRHPCQVTPPEMDSPADRRLSGACRSTDRHCGELRTKMARARSSHRRNALWRDDLHHAPIASDP